MTARFPGIGTLSRIAGRWQLTTEAKDSVKGTIFFNHLAQKFVGVCLLMGAQSLVVAVVWTSKYAFHSYENYQSLSRSPYVGYSPE